MVEKAEVKPEDLNFDDLLQCPVCYEIPTGQIFQCNEGHHVCGQCKMRLDVCPVCRALFFGTRNYAMEELIANIRKMRSFKLGGTSRSGSSSSSTPAKDTSAEHEDNVNEDDDADFNSNVAILPVEIGPPQACSGLFRCLCCKPGHTARLPSGRLLNHLRYFHAPHLLEGRSENGVYLQAWQFATVPGKLVTAIRIADMGIFFLIIEIENDSVCSWLFMAAAPWVAHAFNYTISICGNDREAIFSDSVWSVRSCEGTLKKRGHCLVVRGQDALALTSPDTISVKLTVRRSPLDQLPQTQPRAVLRIANRVNSNQNSTRVSNDQNSSGDSNNQIPAFGLDPFLHELQNDVARLSRAFATLGREAELLVQSEAEMSARIEASEQPPQSSRADAHASGSEAAPSGNSQPSQQGLSKKARRNMRLRMLAALDEPTPPVAPPNNHIQAPPASNASMQNVAVVQPRQNTPTQPRQNTPATQPRQNGPATQPRQNTPVAQPRQNTPATQLNQNMSASELRQNAPATRPRQNMSATQVRQNTAAAQPQQNTVTQPRQETSTNQVRQNTSATQPRQNTSATRPRPNSAATQPIPNGVATQPRPNSATTQPRQDNVVSQQRQNEVHLFTGFAVVTESTPVAPPPTAPSSSSQQPASGSRNKKKRRQRARR